MEQYLSNLKSSVFLYVGESYLEQSSKLEFFFYWLEIEWYKYLTISVIFEGVPGGSVVKNPPTSAEVSGDMGSIPGSGGSPGGGNGNPLQSSCLGNPMANKVMLKSFKLGSNNVWTEKFQMFKLDIEKAEEPEMKLSISIGS